MGSFGNSNQGFGGGLSSSNGVTGSGTNNQIAYFNSDGSSIASLPTSTYPSLTELSYVKGTTSAIQTQINSLNSYTSLINDEVVLGQQGLGSAVKSVGLGCRTWTNITIAAALNDGVIFLLAVYLPQSATLTGVKWWQQVQGNYTADNENRVGLYSYSGGTLTLVASSANDGNLWKGTAQTLQNKEFSTPYVATQGVYYIGLLYNSSAQVAAPTIGSAPNKLNGNQADFTNSAKLNGTVSSATLSSSIAISSAGTTIGNLGAFLY